MVMFKCDRNFRGKKENKVFPANEPFEMTIERAEELQKNVKERYNIDLKFERAEEEVAEEEAEEKAEPKKKKAKAE